MKKTMIILITLLIVILSISFTISKEKVVIKEDNRVELIMKEIRQIKPKYKEPEPVVTVKETVSEQLDEMPIPDSNVKSDVVIQESDDILLPPLYGQVDTSLNDLKKKLKPKRVVLRESEDLLPPEPKKAEVEETYFYEGKVITKTEYIKLNIKEDIKPEELYTDDNEYSFDNVDKTFEQLAPEPLKVKRAKKKDSNTPDLNDLLN